MKEIELNMKRSKSVGFVRSIPARIINLGGTWTRTCRVESISDENIEISVDDGPLDFDFADDSNEFFLVLSSGELPVYRHCDVVAIIDQKIRGRLTGRPFKGYTEPKLALENKTENPATASLSRREPRKRVLGASLWSRRRRRGD